MSPSHECRVLDDKIAYWRFYGNARIETFRSAFEEFNAIIHRPEVDALVVVVDRTDEAWGDDIQDLWLRTGQIAETAGVRRWGVVAPISSKSLLARFLVSGAQRRQVGYDYKVSHSESAILDWVRR